jgi:ribosomal protein L14
MLISQIMVEIFDNSGIKKVKCIGINKKPYQGFGRVGVIFTGVVITLNKKNISKKKIKKGSIVKCLFFCSKKEYQFESSGFFLKHLTKNGAITLSQASTTMEVIPQGSRFEGYYPLSCYKKNLFFINSFNKTIL